MPAQTYTTKYLASRICEYFDGHVVVLKNRSETLFRGLDCRNCKTIFNFFLSQPSRLLSEVII